jgi:protein associated with RNAse G/E
VTQIDLDLDVIRTRSGETLVIDHDEFEDHQVRFGYPPEIVNATERAAEQSLAMLRNTDPPFDGCHAEWMMRTR